MVLLVSLAVGGLLFLVLVIWSLMCCIKKTRPVKRYEKLRQLTAHAVCLYLHQLLCYMCWVVFSSPVYLSAEAFSLLQDSPTRCFSQAAHEAALDSAPCTSASRCLWSLRLPKSANLCSLPDQRLQRWSPAEQLQRSVCLLGSVGNWIWSYRARVWGTVFIKTAVQIGLLSFLNPSQPPKNFKTAVQPSQFPQVTRLTFIYYLILSILIPTVQN